MLYLYPQEITILSFICSFSGLSDILLEGFFKQITLTMKLLKSIIGRLFPLSKETPKPPISSVVRLGVGYAIELDYGYDCAKHYVVLSNISLSYGRDDLDIYKCISHSKGVVIELRLAMIKDGLIR